MPSAREASKTKAAAMAAATRGRKTSFRSRREVLDRVSHADADEQIEDGLAEYRASREEEDDETR